MRCARSRRVVCPVVLTLVAVTIGDTHAFAITPGDVDVLAGQTQEQAVAQAIRRLRQALAEARELQQPGRPMRAGSLAVVAAIWLVAVVMAHSDLPGTDSAAFKGMSVFVSPHFVFNPAEKVWVPQERWHEAPAEMPMQAADRDAGDGERG